MNEYVVTINGLEHSMLLSDADAKRYGDAAKRVESPVEDKRRKPSNKARTDL